MEPQASRSPSIAALALALSKAQGAMEGAAKGALNPHFKTKYADLASVWDACRTALAANELAVIQLVRADGPRVSVETVLAHSSGEWIGEALTLTAVQDTPQGVGSAITYGRRYGLSAVVGIAPEDDDGNGASRPNGNGQAQRPTPAPPDRPAGYPEWIAGLRAIADEGPERLKAAWDASSTELRRYLTQTDPVAWGKIKARAADVGAPS